jgi:carbohydrate-selective porin OprB
MMGATVMKAAPKNLVMTLSTGLLFLVASTANAQPAGTQPADTMASALTLSPTAPDTIDEDLAEAAARPAGLLKYGPVSLIDPLWKQLNQKTQEFGLNVGLAYTMVYQVASGGPGDRDAAGGDIDLFGDWRLLGAKDDPLRGYLYFAAENRHQLFTPIAPGALGGEIGSLWGTTNGFGEQSLALKELYWQQHFGGDRLIVRVGKLDPENYYNSNYWQSDSKFFLNKAFSSFPVRAFPGNGLGVNITAKFDSQWYLSTGFQDAQGKKTEAGFDTFFDDFNLFGAGEIGFTPTIKDLGRGTYRFTAWYRDAGKSDGKPHDAGFDVSFDQHVGPHLVPFFRYGWGEGNINGIEHMVSAGVGWEGDLVTKSDMLGIGGAWGRPSDHSLNDQYAAEVFYRLQVSPDNQLTVGYQVIIDPTFAPDDDVVGVFELRWRIAM